MIAGNPKSKIQNPKSSGVVVPRPVTWHGKAAAFLIFSLLRLLNATLRYRWHDQSGLFAEGAHETVLFSIWHNRLALSLFIFRNYLLKRQPARRLAALVSASRDGGLLARVLEHFGVQPVRGSTSRRGPQALLELTRWAEQNYDLAITPDGPRGPCYVVQEGIISLAQLTGRPIVPVSYCLNWKIRPKSWDRFQIPLPLARVEVVFGRPIRVPRDATDSERETLRQQLEQAMKEITRD